MKRNKFFAGSEIWNYRLCPTSKLIFLYLCRCTDAAGECFPSLKTISEACGVCKRTVQRALKELEAAGAVTVEERYIRNSSGRRRSSNLYRLTASVKEAAENEAARGIKAPSGEALGGSCAEAAPVEAREGTQAKEALPLRPRDKALGEPLTKAPENEFDTSAKSEGELEALLERIGVMNYEDKNVALLASITIGMMWRRAYTSVEGQAIPRELVRKRLRLLEAGSVDGALSALKNPDVANPVRYFEACIFNAPADQAGRLAALQEKIKAYGAYSSF